MTEQDLMDIYKRKLNSSKYVSKMDNVIYQYYLSKDKKYWDLNNMYFYGIGVIKASNFQNIKVSPDPIPEDLNNNYQFFVLKNKDSSELNGLLIPPINNSKTLIYDSSFFPIGMPCFDIIKEGVLSKNNKIFTNIIDESVEVTIHNFQKPIFFGNLLSQHHQKLNAECLKNLSKKNMPALQDLLKNITKKEQNQHVK